MVIALGKLATRKRVVELIAAVLLGLIGVWLAQ
jgi:hypothetical protein